MKLFFIIFKNLRICTNDSNRLTIKSIKNNRIIKINKPEMSLYNNFHYKHLSKCLF